MMNSELFLNALKWNPDLFLKVVTEIFKDCRPRTLSEIGLSVEEICKAIEDPDDVIDENSMEEFIDELSVSRLPSDEIKTIVRLLEKKFEIGNDVNECYNVADEKQTIKMLTSAPEVWLNSNLYNLKSSGLWEWMALDERHQDVVMSNSLYVLEGIKNNYYRIINSALIRNVNNYKPELINFFFDFLDREFKKNEESNQGKDEEKDEEKDQEKLLAMALEITSILDIYQNNKSLRPCKNILIKVIDFLKNKKSDDFENKNKSMESKVLNSIIKFAVNDDKDLLSIIAHEAKNIRLSYIEKRNVPTLDINDGLIKEGVTMHKINPVNDLNASLELVVNNISPFDSLTLAEYTIALYMTTENDVEKAVQERLSSVFLKELYKEMTDLNLVESVLSTQRPKAFLNVITKQNKPGYYEAIESFDLLKTTQPVLKESLPSLRL